MVKEPMHLAEICKECANTLCKIKIYTFVPLEKNRVICVRYIPPKKE